MRVFGRGNPFFDILQTQADTAHQAALVLHRLVRNSAHHRRYADELAVVKANGDDLVHQLAVLADATFVTPLDKEDLRGLSQTLDAIVDHIEATAARFVIYQIPYARPDVDAMAQCLVETTEAVQELVSALPAHRNRKGMSAQVARVRALEQSADVAFRTALAGLFETGSADVLNVAKWKDIYERVEYSVDACEATADLLEALIIKYS